MNVHDVHWHDAQILEVRLSTADDTLRMRLSYPVDWENDLYEERVVEFLDYYAYQEHEGPFLDCPTILEVNVEDRENGVSHWRVDTNAGYREFWCREFRMESPSENGARGPTEHTSPQK